MKYVYSLLLGAVAFFVAWGGWHLWIDHQSLHILINRAVAQEQAAQRPTPKPVIEPVIELPPVKK